MKTSTISNVTNVNSTFSAAQAQINTATHNILYWVRALNAMASKNEYCDGVPVMDAGILCQTLLPENVRRTMKAGQFFHASLFTQDSRGRACIVKVSKTCPVFGLDLVDVTPNGWAYLAPVQLSLLGVLRAFRVVAQQHARALDSAERAERAAQRERERAARALAKELRRLKKDFVSGAISARVYELQVRDARRRFAA